VGLPGWLKSSVTPFLYAQRRVFSNEFRTIAHANGLGDAAD